MRVSQSEGRSCSAVWCDKEGTGGSEEMRGGAGVGDSESGVAETSE
jgi:hypothetical protein